MKIKKFLKKCKKFSMNLYEREADWYLGDYAGLKVKEISDKDLSYELSTYLFDISFEVDEESWEYLEVRFLLVWHGVFLSEVRCRECLQGGGNWR